jgi:hypothetical protein
MSRTFAIAHDSADRARREAATACGEAVLLLYKIEMREDAAEEVTEMAPKIAADSGLHTSTTAVRLLAYAPSGERSRSQRGVSRP